ncbi:MAG: DUF362 domain-containing protein [Syntrophales bacterium]|nr:DUF362 domain-containing protein [Syntrophales bacterium]
MKIFTLRSSYDYERLRTDVYTLVSKVIPDSILTGKRVLVKPNLLLPATPEQAVCTHPLVVRATVEYVLEAGGRPIVADSPALGTFARVMKVSGLEEALCDLPVLCLPFRNSIAVDCGPPFGDVELAQEAVESEVIINLPKLKTHSQMLLTLGVKNLFGCCVGHRKVEWHLRAGVNRQLFADLLLSIAKRLSPAVTLLDGILSLEGEGPGKRGHPRPLGTLIASDHLLGVDIAVSRMLGLRIEEVPVLAAADRQGLLPDPKEIPAFDMSIKDFQLPTLEPLLATVGPFDGVLRKYFVARPVPDKVRCLLCGECAKMCPVQAIKMGKGLDIAYDRCIRCYCCIEVCPYGAMAKEEGLFARLIRHVFKR